MRWRSGDNDTALRLAKGVAAWRGPLAAVILSRDAAKEGDHVRGAEEFSRGFSVYQTGFNREDFVAIYRGAHGDETARKAALAVVARHPNDELAGTFLLMLGEPEQSFARFEESRTRTIRWILKLALDSGGLLAQSAPTPGLPRFREAHRPGRLLESRIAGPTSASPRQTKGRTHFTCQ